MTDDHLCPRPVEAHLLDVDGDLSGQRLRADQTFDSLDAIVGQLERDEANARAVLAEQIDHLAAAPSPPGRAAAWEPRREHGGAGLGDIRTEPRAMADRPPR